MNLFHSIRWRLQLWYGIFFALLLIGLGMTAHHLAVLNLFDKVDADIYQYAHLVNSATRRPPRPGNPNGMPRGPEGRRPPLLTQEHIFTKKDLARGFYFAVWRKNDSPSYYTSANAPQDIPEPSNEPDGFRTRGEVRETFITTNPGDHVVIGHPIEDERQEARSLAWKIASGSALLWGGIMLAGWWLTGRALKPLDTISDTAERIAAGDLSRRINTRHTDTELGRLAAVLNSTFARLEAAFARQTQFTGDAAHELRTPITVMLTHLQNLRDNDDLSGENREAVLACLRAAQRMRHLIESLLRLARIDKGPGSVSLTPCDLAEVAKETIDLITPLAQERGMTIEPDLKPSRTVGDPMGVAQVISNLLSNAVQYGKEGGTIRVITYQSGGQAVCTVSDDGPGIAEEHLPNIFERFYRIDRSRNRQTGRSGLGLAISKAIVVAHGGEIHVRSATGAGAHFTVRIPGNFQ